MHTLTILSFVSRPSCRVLRISISKTALSFRHCKIMDNIKVKDIKKPRLPNLVHEVYYLFKKVYNVGI